MSAATTAPPPTAESRSGRLLALVRKLIDYGKELAATIRERIAEPVFARTCFGTNDLAVIVRRIAHGVQLANALEARVLQRAAWLDKGPRPSRPQAARNPAKPAAPRPAADAPLSHLPTAEQIAAEVRRRPIGTVIADICRDLGILPSHPLWREVQNALIVHNGGYARLLIDILHRAFPRAARYLRPAKAASPGAALAPTGTGPP